MTIYRHELDISLSLLYQLQQQKMKGYRYNAEKREDRRFNDTGREKNPGAVKYFATNLAYAERYKVVFTDEGDVAYECALQVEEINAVLFDMEAGFRNLAAYKEFIDAQIGQQRRDYTAFMNSSSKKSERLAWAKRIEELSGREEELVAMLRNHEFQHLSDYEAQAALIDELRALGYEGYFTKNEIAVF